MTDNMERLRAYVADDHRRWCHGTWIPRETKQYSCTCGYDTRGEDLLVAATNVIERLSVNLGGSVAALKMCNDQIEQLHEQLAKATAEIEKLRELWENSPSWRPG